MAKFSLYIVSEFEVKTFCLLNNTQLTVSMYKTLLKCVLILALFFFLFCLEKGKINILKALKKIKEDKTNTNNLYHNDPYLSKKPTVDSMEQYSFLFFLRFIKKQNVYTKNYIVKTSPLLSLV